MLLMPQDEVYDDFFRNGHFTKGYKHEVPRRLKDLVVWLLWTIVLSVPLYYYVGYLIMTGSYTTLLTAILVIVLCKYPKKKHSIPHSMASLLQWQSVCA